MKIGGFTFLELVVLLSIIGILALSIAIRSPGQESRLLAQKERVIQDIRYAQSLAMSRGTRCRIVFGSDQYQIEFRNPTTHTWVRVNNPTTGLASQPLEPGMTFSHTTLRDRILVFNSLGKPFQGDQMLDFIINETVTLSMGSIGTGSGCSRNRRAASGLGVITIAENTGYVW